MNLRIEHPTAQTISDLVTTVAGWISCDARPSRVSVLVGGEAIPTKVLDRPDVRQVFPDRLGIGFNATVDLRSGRLPPSSDIEIDVDGKRTFVGALDRAAVQAKSAQWLAAKQSKLERIACQLQCPVCASRLAVPMIGFFTCDGCGSRYTRTSTSIDLLPESLRRDHRIDSTDNVSAHPYPSEALEMFEWTTARDGLLLDMGAGDQRQIKPFIICSEVESYPATDILAVGQQLPFLDCTFDAVFSNAVLEHVTDPFGCAAEMMRVLRPGGRIFCSVPFIQPEHGYPYHYYNMTQDGLTNLFTRLGARLDAKGVADWGHPLHAGQWFLSSYLQYLPEHEQKRLASLTINEFLRLCRTPDEPIFARISDEGRRVLACATYATFRRPDDA